MADKPTQLILEALGRAAAERAAGADAPPLVAVKGRPGLFPATTPGRAAAQRCLDEGLVRPDAPGTVALTERGLRFLSDHRCPRQVLEDFLRALEARHGHAEALADAARRIQAGIAELRPLLLAALGPPPDAAPPAAAEPEPDPRAVLAGLLGRWQPTGPHQDCPLPELYRRARAAVPGLTIGAFHDALRRLHDEGRLYLHPWTGPLYDLPEPPFALLVGHEVAYYASPRAVRLTAAS